VKDLILNKVLVKTCVANGRAEGLTCVFVAASWSWGRRRVVTLRDLVEGRKTSSSTS